MAPQLWSRLDPYPGCGELVVFFVYAPAQVGLLVPVNCRVIFVFDDRGLVHLLELIVLFRKHSKLGFLLGSQVVAGVLIAEVEQVRGIDPVCNAVVEKEPIAVLARMSVRSYNT